MSNLVANPANIFVCTAELDCKVSHLALAWVAKNPNTSTVILGASRPEQIVDNLKALDVIPKLTPEVLEKIESILGNKPAPLVSHGVRLYRMMSFSNAISSANIRETSTGQVWTAVLKKQ